MPAHIFLDTMVWLHYQPVNQIDWPQLLGVDQVTIIVPRITIRELDRQKNQHPNPTIRDRAARVLVDLERLLQTDAATVRTGTTIARYAGIPAFDSAPVPLDPSWNDDALLATMLAWQEASGIAGGILVTQDTGPVLTARDIGIRTFRLPDSLRLPPALEAAERELANLKRELLRLQAAQPILRLGFPDSEATSLLAVVIPNDPPRAESEWSAERETLATKYPPVDKLPPQSSMLVSPSELSRYREDRFHFLEKYRDFQIARWEHQRERTLVFRFEPSLMNTGTQPADETDVEIHIPDPLEIFEEIPDIGEPRPPAPPQRPMTALEQVSTSLRMSIPHAPNFADLLGQRDVPNVSRPTVRKTNS